MFIGKIFSIFNIFVHWKFFYKLFFFCLIFGVILAQWINPLINGINISDFAKKENWSENAVYNFEHDKGDYTLNFFSYFTVQSNLLVVFCLFIGLIFGNNVNKIFLLKTYFNLACTVYITITFIIFNLVLLPFKLPTEPLDILFNIVCHEISPIVMFFYLFFIYKGNFISTKECLKTKLLTIYIYPIIYLIVNMIRGEFRLQDGKVFPYQYFFLNVHKVTAGLQGWVWLIFIAIFIILLILVLVTVYNLLGKRLNRIVNKI